MIFQFPGLLRGPTAARYSVGQHLYISIPRPLARPDESLNCVLRLMRYFNSQASCEARRPTSACTGADKQFQFPGLLRGPTLPRFPTPFLSALISIPRPLARPDEPLGGPARGLHLFQFPGLLRGPTQPSKPGRLFLCNFNSQASCEARHRRSVFRAGTRAISIPRPLARPDLDPAETRQRKQLFQFPGLLRGPTPARRRRRPCCRFQFPGLLRGPTSPWLGCVVLFPISIPRPLARPDIVRDPPGDGPGISIPRPLARPDA